MVRDLKVPARPQIKVRRSRPGFVEMSERHLDALLEREIDLDKLGKKLKAIGYPETP